MDNSNSIQNGWNIHTRKKKLIQVTSELSILAVKPM